MKTIFRRLPKESTSESSATATSDKPAANQLRKGFVQKVNNLTKRIKRGLSRRSKSSSTGVIQSAQERPTSSTTSQAPETASDAAAKEEHDEDRVSVKPPVKHKELEKAKKALKVAGSALILVAEVVSAVGDVCLPAKAAANGLLHINNVVQKLKEDKEQSEELLCWIEGHGRKLEAIVSSDVGLRNQPMDRIITLNSALVQAADNISMDLERNCVSSAVKNFKTVTRTKVTVQSSLNSPILEYEGQIKEINTKSAYKLLGEP